MSLAHRCHQLELLTDWAYRSACIDLTQMSYRTGEPDGVERDVSRVWQQVFDQMWRERRSRERIAAELRLPEDEFLRMTFGLTATAPPPRRGQVPRAVS